MIFSKTDQRDLQDVKSILTSLLRRIELFPANEYTRDRQRWPDHIERAEFLLNRMEMFFAKKERKSKE